MKSNLSHPHYFRYTKEHSEDDITKLRHEIKFEYINTDVCKIDTILGANCRRVIHAGEESMVNSIYFDDFALTSLRQNFYGIGLRIKLRLRWYDSKLPGKNQLFLKLSEETITLLKKNVMRSHLSIH